MELDLSSWNLAFLSLNTDHYIHEEINLHCLFWLYKLSNNIWIFMESWFSCQWKYIVYYDIFLGHSLQIKWHILWLQAFSPSVWLNQSLYLLCLMILWPWAPMKLTCFDFSFCRGRPWLWRSMIMAALRIGLLISEKSM